jgi:hypothetical protein
VLVNAYPRGPPLWHMPTRVFPPPLRRKNPKCVGAKEASVPPYRRLFIGVSMRQDVTTLERAFELAKSGNYITIEEIRQKLKAENFDRDRLVGPSLLAQLRAIMGAAQSKG